MVQPCLITLCSLLCLVCSSNCKCVNIVINIVVLVSSEFHRNFESSSLVKLINSFSMLIIVFEGITMLFCFIRISLNKLDAVTYWN